MPQIPLLGKKKTQDVSFSMFENQLQTSKGQGVGRGEGLKKIDEASKSFITNLTSATKVFGHELTWFSSCIVLKLI